MICIAIIGTLNLFRERNDKTTFKLQAWQFYLTFLIHSSFLIILKDYKKYGFINNGSLILMFLAILIIYYLPWWPYYKSTRLEIIQQIFLINLFLYGYHYIIY